MEQNINPEKSMDERRREMEAEIAANEVADRAYRRRLVRNLIIIGVVIVTAIGGYLGLRPHDEPEVYYTDGSIDYAKQADKLRRTSGFKSVQEFRGGYAIVSDGKKYGIVDVKGTVVCPVKYEAIESNYSEHYPDLCEVRLAGKLGLVDKQGREVVKPIYDDIGPLNGSSMQVTLGKEQFYIDTEGNRVEL